MKLTWCNAFAEIYAQLDWGCQSAIGICAVFYIYRSAIRCTKFGVVVFKASILNWRRGSICHMYMCIVLYMKVIWCNGFAEIYV